MSDAYICRRGGGGLHFKVVGQTTQPQGIENLIWVNTDTVITSWAFSATAPASPAEGMVWFTTSIVSSTAFNALKKNRISVYPASCKQYISGAWIIKEAKTYQGGTWKDWELFLYKAGNEFVNITGGWTNFQNGVITRGSDCLQMTAITSYKYAHIGPANKIDLSNYTTLAYDVRTTKACSMDVIVSNTPDSDTGAAKVNIATTTRTQGSIDVTNLSGEYYIYVTAYTGDAGQSVSSLYEMTLYS